MARQIRRCKIIPITFGEAICFYAPVLFSCNFRTARGFCWKNDHMAPCFGVTFIIFSKNPNLSSQVWKWRQAQLNELLVERDIGCESLPYVA